MDAAEIIAALNSADLCGGFEAVHDLRILVSDDQDGRRREEKTNRHVHVHENKEVCRRSDAVLLQCLKAVDRTLAV